MYPVWIGGEWVDVPIPSMGGEQIVVPNVAVIVRSEDGSQILLQRRDKPMEPVRGKLEIPGGRWRAGESPDEAVIREVREETGLEIVGDTGSVRLRTGQNRSCAIVRPVAVINGMEGCYPSLHVLFECTGRGEPRPQEGETADPRWWFVDDVESWLESNPDAFVDQTQAMLAAWLETTAGSDFV